MPLQATSGAASYDAFGGGKAAVPNYIEDVFSTYLYTGTGALQTINNGIDLSTKGGMVWSKSRSAVGDNHVYDTARGIPKVLFTNGTNPSTTYTSGYDLTSFNTNGFSLGPDDYGANSSGVTYSSWTFRKQPKFFDVVTYTGDGIQGKTIAHDLGSVPGCIIVKRTDSTAYWPTYHTSLGAGGCLFLNTTEAAYSGLTNRFPTTPTSTIFYVGNAGDVNASGGTYVAYLFAHNAGGFGLTGTDNVISCGSFTTDGSGFFTATLGYEPQWVMYKQTNAADDWKIIDTMRGMTNPYTNGARLLANSSAAEGTGNGFIEPTATGFYGPGTGAAGGAYIYIAIRRGPMKVPTDATKVFAPVTRTGTGSATTQTAGFPVDLFIPKTRNGGTAFTWSDRLRGDVFVQSANAQAENYPAYTTFDNQTGVNLTSYFYPNNAASEPYVNYNFRRAPSYFDEVCYTGTGSARALTHNLTVAPELIICKGRNVADFWPVYATGIPAQSVMALDFNIAPLTSQPSYFPSAPSSTVFNVGNNQGLNGSGYTYVAYLFASCPGVSKVGSYTGNGTTQTINCGFTGGARFVMIKRTDAAGDWYVYDTARGMTTLTDPYLLLNSAAAESATLGSVTTVSTGFAVNASVLAAINTNAASYIFLAIA